MQTFQSTWGELLKWLTVIVSVVASYVIMQYKVQVLEKENIAGKLVIEKLELRVGIEESSTKVVETKLTIISEDTKYIRDKLDKHIDK